jgi:hypothetical protein
MDFLKEISELASKGCTIDFQHDHYKDGINCNWSITFTKHYDGIKEGGFDIEPWDERKGTMWHGDNHEYGDPHQSMEAAVKLAKFMLENEDCFDAYFDRFPTRQNLSDGRRKLKEFERTLYSQKHNDYWDNYEKNNPNK